jgi:hypothetical protein
MALEFSSGNQRDEVVRNEEKAYDMAEAELEARELKALYRKYLDDPATFRREEAALVEIKRKEDVIPQTLSDDFVTLAQEGVHLDDFDAWANAASHREGKRFDYMQSLASKNVAQLHADIVQFRIMEMIYRRTLAWYDAKKKGTPLETSIASEKFYANYILRMTNPSADGTIDAFVGLEEGLEDMAEQREAAAAELQKRKSGVKEAA